MEVAFGVQVLDVALLEADARPLAAGLGGGVEDGAGADVLDLHAHLGAATADLLVLVREDLDDLSVELHHRPTLEVAGRNHVYCASGEY